MKISIIGQAGSGKSTFAHKISKKLNIPHLQIDKFWLEANGHKLKPGDMEGREKVRAHIKENVESFIKQDAWVSDGWYPRVQTTVAERADHIFFLDIPLYRRLLNHLQRVFVSKEKRHKEVAKWDDVKFIYQIIHRTFLKGSKLKQFVKKNYDKVITFRKYKEIDKYLEGL